MTMNSILRCLTSLLMLGCAQSAFASSVQPALGPRTDLDISRALSRQVEAERWTQLDRQLVRDANEQGVIDVAPSPARHDVILDFSDLMMF